MSRFLHHILFCEAEEYYDISRFEVSWIEVLYMELIKAELQITMNIDTTCAQFAEKQKNLHWILLEKIPNIPENMVSLRGEIIGINRKEPSEKMER